MNTTWEKVRAKWSATSVAVLLSMLRCTLPENIKVDDETFQDADR